MSVGHNTIAAEQLQSFVNRIERLNDEIKDLQDDRKEVFKEAKLMGFDVAVMKDVIRARKMEQPEREERLRLIETYLRALGDFADTPLGEAAIESAQASVH